jgi:hypothetical protein
MCLLTAAFKLSLDFHSTSSRIFLEYPPDSFLVVNPSPKPTRAQGDLPKEVARHYFRQQPSKP